MMGGCPQEAVLLGSLADTLIEVAQGQDLLCFKCRRERYTKLHEEPADILREECAAVLSKDKFTAEMQVAW